jgi:hypothetical protein
MCVNGSERRKRKDPPNGGSFFSGDTTPVQ